VRSRTTVPAIALVLALLPACAPSAPDAGSEDTGGAASPSLAGPSEPTLEQVPPVSSDTEVNSPAPAAERPDWLGTRVLPLAPDGFGERLATPAELVDRRLVTPPLPEPAPPDPEGDEFISAITSVPDGVLARSTWTTDCPVPVDALRYVTIRFFGFDGLVHTGELIVHADVADDVVTVFSALHAAHFPLEEVRVIAREELDAPATGDGNVTSAFVCRPTVGSSRWSEHAFGRALDVNPFHNPYVRGDLVLPELASAYVDRSDVRPGMVLPDGPVTEAFASVGWDWGGDWNGAATDPMHFSVSDR
jgi:hypothetical protein